MKVIILVLLAVCVLGEENSPEVRVRDGSLRGSYQESKKGRTFSAFVGIPYAKPPVGDLRFEGPVPVEPWDGVLDVSKNYHNICPQSNPINGYYTPIKGDEDCLVLNVYTPKLNSNTDQLLPVIFYIYGGALVVGRATPELYGPEIIMDKDVVLVIPNYRLGALGFLSTGDGLIPGNNGLKDQNLALKWTKQNIHSFGGDPNKITVIGHSAGAACAHYQMLSPLSKDLIHGVIALSATAVASWALSSKDEAINVYKRLANFLNCTQETNEEIVKCLRTIDAYDIIRQEQKFVEWSVDPIILFKPVIEENSIDAFLPESPVDIIKSGKAARVPFITGITTDDGAIKAAGYYRSSEWIKDLDQEFNRVFQICLQYPKYKSQEGSKIRKFYFGDGPINNSTKAELTNLFTDAMFLSGADLTIRLHAQYTNYPVYYYLYGFRGSHTFSVAFGDPEHNYGVCHGDELFYIFKLGYFPAYKLSNDDEAMSEVFMKVWENFVNTGNPTPSTSALLPVKWEPVKREHMNYFYIKNPSNMEMKNGLYPERAKFWADLNLYNDENTKRTEL